MHYIKNPFIIAAAVVFVILIILLFIFFVPFQEADTAGGQGQYTSSAETSLETSLETTSEASTETATEVTSEITTAATSEIPVEMGDDWANFLVNSDNPLPDNYIDTVVLEKVYNDFQLDARCAGAAREMLSAAKRDGFRLIVISAYRSEKKQSENFEEYRKRLVREGMSEEEALAVTASQIAQPGESEHNAAIALDILSEDWYVNNDDITEDFELTPEFGWLSENAWKYGFIIRYGKDKTEITGFDYEPWHYRYVGVARAKFIFDNGLSLEEYTELYGY